jgi:Carbohydrate binding module (family 6)/Glycosyl hydrolases family 43
MFERNGVYYLTYPHVENKIERLEYAIGNNPLGPFKIVGAIMDESPTGCWTNHQSIIQFKNQWYLFYHSNDYSPKFDKARSIRIDSLSFNADGTIKKVIPTLRGVGISKASSQIQIDRFTQLSDEGTSIAFLDTLNTFKGWKTIFAKPGAWVQYNAVDFEKKTLKTIAVNALSTNGALLQVRVNAVDGPVIAEIKIPATKEWSIVKAPVLKIQNGVKNIFVVMKNGQELEADWISFQ